MSGTCRFLFYIFLQKRCSFSIYLVISKTNILVTIFNHALNAFSVCADLDIHATATYYKKKT